MGKQTEAGDDDIDAGADGSRQRRPLSREGPAVEVSYYVHTADLFYSTVWLSSRYMCRTGQKCTQLYVERRGVC